MISALVMSALFFVCCMVLFLGVKEQKGVPYICVQIIFSKRKGVVTIDFEHVKFLWTLQSSQNDVTFCNVIFKNIII